MYYLYVLNYHNSKYIRKHDLICLINDNVNDIHVYKDSDRVNEVNIDEKFKDLSGTPYEIVNTVRYDYKSDMEHYKHTFKKNEDGSVYWLSSEKM